MITAIGRFCVRRHRLILILALLFVVASGAIGGSVIAKLSGGGFEDPKAASTRAAAVLNGQFKAGQPNFVVLARANDGVDAADAAAAGEAITKELASSPNVQTVVSYWTSGHSPQLRSRDGNEALIVARISGTDDQIVKRAEDWQRRIGTTAGPLTLRAGGDSVVSSAVNNRIKKDLATAELIVFPITFVLLVLAFGGVIAALLPLVVGVVSIMGTLLVLRLVVSFTDVSIYSLNLTTGLGLGLAIDYALFVVTRYREEVASGATRDDAVLISVRTAGRTVLFSALTVALSLGALLVFPLYFLRSFAYAGIAVVAVAATGAVVVLPALLAALGPRVDSLTLFRRKPADMTHGFWHRTATSVMRRPLVFGGIVLVLLMILGAPFTGVRFGLPDDRVLPGSDKAHQVSQSLRNDFAGRSGSPLFVVAQEPGSAPNGMADYAQRLSAVSGVEDVQSSAGTYAAGKQVAPPSASTTKYSTAAGFWLELTPTVEPYSTAGKQLVHDVRATPAPAPVLVGGMSAQFVDTEASLGSKLPWAAAIIVAAMIIVLFLFTGSVVIPAKALVLNLLSLSATFGAMVWIFQKGHLAGLVGHPIITGTVDTSMPILMFCVAFGLSMDYEVFLLSRIKETYDLTRDNTRSVAIGLERTGRLVTVAAALIAVVWLSFLSSGVTFIKMLGLGMALAVIADATLVRGVLVPAFMRLAGDWNWWAPAPLRRLHNRIGLRDDDAVPIPSQRTLTARATSFGRPDAVGTDRSSMDNV